MNAIFPPRLSAESPRAWLGGRVPSHTLIIVIEMALKEVPNTRFREIYGGRRIEDKAVFGGELTQPLDNSTNPPKYEQLPLLSEVCMDFGRLFNRLNVKKFDGKLLGQTLDREDILPAIDPRFFGTLGYVVAPDTRNAWSAGMPLIYGNAGVDNRYGGFNRANARLALFRNSSDGNPVHSLAGLNANQKAQLLIRGYATGVSSSNANYNTILNPGIGKTWTQPGSQAGEIDYFSGTEAKNWMKNRFNYTKATNAENGGVAVDAPSKAEVDASWIGEDMYSSGGADGNASIDDQAVNELILDFMSNNWIHSSALSLIYQYHDALINIASQTQYLASELVGFYEKGLKGDFLRHYSDDEVFMMIALVELGAAVRRQVIVRNINRQDSSDDITFSGAINPFFMYVDTLKSGSVTNSVKRLYTPWWLTMLIDRHYFEYDNSVDDVRDIHREDLFHGIRLLLEAASLEYGMITKSTGTPYLDFFKDFESAELHDLTDFTSVPSLRSLMMAGYSKAEDYANYEDPDSVGFAFFKEFLANSKIVETERLDLQKDYKEMDSISVITGDMFKLGQQMLGDFEYTTHHRLTRFGSKSVDVKIKPDLCWRPLSYRNVFWNPANVGLSDLPVDLNKFRAAGNVASTASMYDADSPYAASSDNFMTAYYEALNNSTSFTDWIGFPSLKKGWSSKLDGVCHERNDMALGYGHIRTGAGRADQKTMYPKYVLEDGVTVLSVTDTPSMAYDVKFFNMGLGDSSNVRVHIMQDEVDAHNLDSFSMQARAPLCPAAYWRLGNTGMLGNFVLRMNRVYQAWQGRTSGLFRRSELKNLLSFTSYNLARELKMNTPDANLAKNAEHILGIMGCGSTGYSPALAVRHVDRKLSDATVHARTSSGVYGNAGIELDVDVLVSPYAGAASDAEDMFFTQHLLAYLLGLYSDDIKSLRLPASYRKTGNGSDVSWSITNTGLWMAPVALVAGNVLEKVYDGATFVTDVALSKGRRTNSSAREWDYFPIGHGPSNLLHSGVVGDVGGAKAAGATISMAGSDNSKITSFDDSGKQVNYSCVRTYFHYYKPLDGDITYVAVTKSGLPYSAVPLYYDESVEGNAEVFNFRTELTGTIMDTNGTTADLLPGHQELFKVWQVYERQSGTFDATATAAAFTFTAWDDVVPSICTGFGVTALPSDGGSEVPGIGGFQGVHSVLPMSGAVFQNGKWLQLLEDRLGGIPGADGSAAEPEGLLKWRASGAKVLVFDQDVLDKSEGLLGALLYVTYGMTHPGQITYMSVLGSDGSVEWELRDSYGWGDAGASATSEDFMATESDTGDIEPLH